MMKLDIRELGVATLLAAWALVAPREAQADVNAYNPGLVANFGEMETARASAMSGALRAAGNGTSSGYSNPATLPLVRTYQIGAMTQITPEIGQWLVGGVIVDSVTSRLAGSFAIDGTPIAADPNGANRTFLDMRLAFGFPVSDRIGLGLTGRYLKVDQSGVGPLGFSAVAGGLQDPLAAPSRLALVNSPNFDVGLLVKLADNLFLGGVGQNLAYVKNGFMPVKVGGGIGYATDALTIEADGLADLNSWSTTTSLKPTGRVMVGGEYVINGVIPVRAGYSYDQGASQNAVSLGSGFLASMFSVEGSVKRILASPGTTTFTIGLAYIFDGGAHPRANSGDDL